MSDQELPDVRFHIDMVNTRMGEIATRPDLTPLREMAAGWLEPLRQHDGGESAEIDLEAAEALAGCADDLTAAIDALEAGR